MDNRCLVALAVNSKECLASFRGRNLNKKHKGIKKGSPGLENENFAQRIKSIVNFNTFEKPPADNKKIIQTYQ